jgi:hypothetical protein
MKRSSTVSQSVRVLVTAAALAAGAIGCGGGSTGTPAMSGACSLADVNKIFTTTDANVTTGCTVINSCHDNAGSAAGLDLTAAGGWQTKLVGKGPVANVGSSADNYSKCAGANRVYLQAGSSPATGLLLDKINPATTAPCGSHMPNLGANLSAKDFACVQSYVNTLTM